MSTEPNNDSAREKEIEQALFAKREKIYPREVHGLFAALRIASVIALLGIFYGLPWFNWDGRQSILLDLPARKFYIFGLTFWPQDFLYLTFLLIIAAMALFFFTTLAGRLWCGYACPQTVWTETFLWIEQLVEGDRRQQMRLDKTKWDFRKFRIKITKHSLWIIFSLFTGFTFVSYFTPARELAEQVLNLSLSPWETFWLFFYGFATYGNAGWMREQVCIYMCPYARFQSAMFDDDTLIVSYDKQRGEPKGARRASIDHRRSGLGDCINCTLCVQVCPTGIDIRDGLQYQCIGCSACIDACDDVMDKMNYPKGLIRYTTHNALEGKPTRVFRPRILLYGFILLSMFTIFTHSVLNRVPLGLDVIRDRNQLYRETMGLIENIYTLKVINMDDKAHTYQLSVSGIDGISIDSEIDTIYVEAGNVQDFPVRLRADESSLQKRSNEISLSLIAIDNKELSVIEHARFLGPIP
ncbi:MAG: cytochrome c oxidase accessory protein CcoG [Gammaproteobacteria bacterium]|jgi:cytochrome c oxidase accessory protein FixG|nr:cytochrome c oxidase accessory protein CcoG [Gammaproteobacteria bacterium]